jgi:uncharacterized delta-60 repeat protein
MAVNINSFSKAPLAKGDNYAWTEDELIASGLMSGNIIILDPMSNDLGGNNKTLYSVDDGGTGTFLQDLLINNVNTGWEFTANGNLIRILNGKIQFDIGNYLSAIGAASVNALGANHILQDTFVYAIQLGNGVLSWAQVSVTIQGVNDGPTAAADTGSAGENHVTSFDVLANDTDVDVGDSKTLQSLGIITVTSANGAVNGIDALAAFTIDGNQIKFTPGALFDALDHNDSATVVVNYTMRDSQGATSSSALTLTINGANDAASITVTAGGDYAVTEAGGIANGMTGDPTASGDLNVSDVDSGEAKFQTPASLAGTYGDFTFDAVTGAWSYTLDNSRMATQLLNSGDLASDALTVWSFDGTDSEAITVHVTGANDAASITVTAGGDYAVTEAGGVENGTVGDPIASGGLDVSDVDNDEARFQAPTSLAGTYGDFTFDELTGAWTYALDNADPDTQALNAGQPAIDSLTVYSYDGTDSETITVNITGTNDAASITVPGDLDIVAATSSNPTISILLGDGTGGFVASTAGIAGGTIPVSSAIGDINGDGAMDIVTANNGSSNVSVLLGDGTGGFTASTTGIGGGLNPAVVALADVNSDDKLDVLVANDTSSNVSVLLGDGAGGFTATTVSSGGLSTVSLAVGDLNGDGNPDIVTANLFSDNLSVLLGDGAGGFTAGTVGLGGGVRPFSVALGDLDGDGDLDAVAANQGTSQVSVLLGDGAGGFTASTTSTGSFDTYSVALGDVNGDGDLDIVTVNRLGNNVSILLGDGAGGFTATTTGLGGGVFPWLAALGDLDGDGDLDIATANQGSHNVSILLGDGAGNFTASVTGLAGGANPLSVVIGNLNTDSDYHVTEAGTAGSGDPNASGDLNITDADAGEAKFATVTPAGLAGIYGDFTFNADTGAWSYALNNADADTETLGAGQSAIDSLTVYSYDGTDSETITVNITGAADAIVVGDGKITTAIGSGNDFGRSVTLQTDGKILVAGESFNGSNIDFALVRYNPDGSLDTSFGSGGMITTGIAASDDRGFSVVVDGSGRILVAGYSGNGSSADFALVRYNADGSLDTSFDGDGKVATGILSDDIGQSVVVQPDGKIVVSGHSFNGSSFDFSLVRYNADGSLDTSFDGDGKIATGIAFHDASYSVALQSDGKLVAAGHSLTGIGVNDFALVRYNTDGSLDTSFDGDGKVTTDFGGTNDVGQSVAIQSDGKILVAGVSANGSSVDFALARYNSDGTLDISFDSDGRVTTSFAAGSDAGSSVTLQPDGKIIVAGQSFNGSNTDFAIARYNADGSLDTTFGDGGKVTTQFGGFADEGYSVTLQTDGKIIVAGHSNNGSDADFALVRYNSDGSLDPTFGADTIDVITPITGSSISEMITGGAGADILAGGGGADYFLFKTSTEGVDHIADFSSVDDLLVLSASGFGGGLQPGGVGSQQFATGSEVSTGFTSTVQRFFFDSDPGDHALWYDADGSGSGFAAVKVLTVNAGVTLSQHDFIIT